ncbi:unnamed protein product [Cunninghamella echinulata]
MQHHQSEHDIFASPHIYYTTGQNARARTRTYTRPDIGSKLDIEPTLRRASYDDQGKARQFLIM